MIKSQVYCFFRHTVCSTSQNSAVTFLRMVDTFKITVVKFIRDSVH